MCACANELLVRPRCLLVLREQDLEYRSVEEKESPDGKRAT